MSVGRRGNIENFLIEIQSLLMTVVRRPKRRDSASLISQHTKSRFKVVSRALEIDVDITMVLYINDLAAK